MASSVSMLDADRVCSSDRGVVSHLSMPPLVLMLSASNLFLSLPFSSFSLHIFVKLKSHPPMTLSPHILGWNGSSVTLVKPCRWSEEDPVVCCCCSFLFPPLTSQATCFTDGKTAKDRLDARKETMDCVNQPTFYLLLRCKKKKKSFLFRNTHVAKLFSLILSIADLQCYVSLRGAAEWFSYSYIDVLLSRFFFMISITRYWI